MKKQLLFLITLITVCASAWAETITLIPDKNATGNSASAYVVTPTTFTANSIEYVINNWNPSNLQIRGNQSSVNLNFTLRNNTPIPGKITKITINMAGNTIIASKVFLLTDVNTISATTGGKNAGTSTSATNQISWDITDDVNYFNIYMEKGGTSGTANLRDIQIEYSTAAPTEPQITAIPSQIAPFNTTTIEPSTQTITVGGANLTADLGLEITGADAQYFSVTPSSLTPIDGTIADTDVTITYASATAGTHTATLTLKSAGAADVTYDLSGTAVLPTLTTPVATQATTITANSFVANWDAVANATEYQLSVSSVAGSTAPADGTKENPYSVADRRNGSATGMNWITGYIVGVVKSSTTTTIALNSGPSFTVKTNIVLADTPTETDGSKLIAVQLSSSTPIYNALNLADNPDCLGKGVKIYGNFENYFGDNPGVKSPTDYVLDVAIGAVNTPIAGSPFTITDAISYEVTGLDPNTDYVYSVIAKGVDYLDSEKSNEIQVTTNDITIVDVESITDITNSDVYYRVNAILEGVYQDGNYVYIKNEKGENPNATTQPANPKPNDDLDKFFEQSSWMKINVPNAQNYAESLIDAGMIGKLNATTGVFEVMSIADPVSIAGTGYKPFYTDNSTKYNSFRIKNFFKQPDGYYFIAPQEFEVAYICQVKYETIDNKSYFVSGNDKIEVIETVALPTDVLAADQGYNSKAIFLKQPKADDPTEKEWVIEHLGGGSITTGVSDITIGNNGVTVIGGNGTIEVLATNASTINVYNLSGATVRSIDNATNNATITVPAGIYIVKVQNSVAKVIVK